VRGIVFDSNVWVSATLHPDSVPDQAINVARQGLVRSLITDEIIGQVRRALLSPKLAADEGRVAEVEAETRRISRLVKANIQLSVVTEKDSDNRILECAVSGRADVIVTGDRKHLLKLGEHAGIPLVSPGDFLRRLPEQQNGG